MLGDRFSIRGHELRKASRWRGGRSCKHRLSVFVGHGLRLFTFVETGHTLSFPLSRGRGSNFHDAQSPIDRPFEKILSLTPWVRSCRTFMLPELHSGRIGEPSLAPGLDAAQHGLGIDFVLFEEITKRIRVKQALQQLAQGFVVPFHKMARRRRFVAAQNGRHESCCSRVNRTPRTVTPDPTTRIW